MYSDCVTNTEYPFEEEGWIPVDDVFCVDGGSVTLLNNEEYRSDLGLYLIIRHESPQLVFYTLYAHLAEIFVREGEIVTAGVKIGVMGQTSRSDDAKRWMAVAPHLHFEVITQDGGSFNPLDFLRAGLTRQGATRHDSL